MTVVTKFMTIRVDELSCVGRNDKGELFLTFKHGQSQRTVYNNVAEMEVDYQILSSAMGGLGQGGVGSALKMVQ